MIRNICAVVILAVASVTGCSHSGGEPPAATTEKSAEPESRVKHGTNGEVVITLDSETQKVMGLQVAALAATELSPELKGFGRVLDPAALGATVADVLSARATAGVSQKEFTRLKALAEQNNASPRALEAAEAAAQRDAALVESVRLKLLASTGKAIAGREDLAGLVQSLASGDSALVRIDLPAGENLDAPPVSARLVATGDDSKPVEAQFISVPSGVDPQTQGRGYLFLVETNQSRLVAGAAVSGFLKLSGAAQLGVTVPRSAVVRFNGATWVYFQTGDDTFERVEVALDSPLADGWFVAKGLKAETKVVTVGAQQLLSEELKGQGSGE